MTDDHGRLRHAMADLAEHGGNTDMYERALARSRQVRRRNVALTSGAAAVAVLGLTAGIVGTTGGTRPDTSVAASPSVPATSDPGPSPTRRPSPVPSSAVPSSAAPSSAVPPSAAPRSSAPAGTSPSRTAPATEPAGKPASKPPSSPPRTADGCPVRKSTLQKISELPEGYRLTAVECWHGWASAGVIAPSPDLQGDGLILFRYRGGTWERHSEGSGYFCADLGIEEIPGDPPPFCTFNK